MNRKITNMGLAVCKSDPCMINVPSPLFVINTVGAISIIVSIVYKSPIKQKSLSLL